MNQNTITILFLVGMFIWFVVTGRMLWKELKKDPYGEYNYAQIAATLGVLGGVSRTLCKKV